MTSETPLPGHFRGEINLVALTGNYPAPEHRTNPIQLGRAQYLLLQVPEAGGYLLIRVRYNAQPADMNDTLTVCGEAILLPECPSSDEVYRLMDLPMPGCAGVVFNCYNHGHRQFVTVLRWHSDLPFTDDLKEQLLGPCRLESERKIGRGRRNVEMPTSYL